MRILFLAPQPFFEERGTPINVRMMVTALSELGHKVDLLVFPHGADVSIPGVTLHRVWKLPGVGKAPVGPSKTKIAYDAAMAVKAFMMAASFPYNAIHAVEEAVFIARALSGVFGVPYIFDMDSHMSDQLRYSGFFQDGVPLRTFERMENATLKNAASVITVCKSLTEVAERHTDAGKIHQIEDIPMAPPPQPSGMDATSLRASLGIAPNAPIALYTGNLEKYQGIGLLLEAAQTVAKSLPSAIILIVGGDSASVARYKAESEAAGLARNVIFTGPRPMEQMPLFYEMADILLSPRTEGTNTPLKIYTYLQTGKAVVATDVPTHTQLLNREIAALTKPEKMEYASAILLLLKEKELREAIGWRGKEFVERNFNYDIFKKKVAAAYEWLNAGKK